MDVSAPEGDERVRVAKASSIDPRATSDRSFQMSAFRAKFRLIYAVGTMLFHILNPIYPWPRLNLVPHAHRVRLGRWIG